MLAAHYSEPFSRSAGGIVRKKDAYALPLTSAYPAAKLVELGKSEAFGVFNKHKGGVRNIDSDLDYGG